jgi:hypothetical protein
MNATKTRLGVVAMAAALVASAPAHAEKKEPIKIGIMDLQAKALTYDAGKVSIEYREFTKEGARPAKLAERTGDDHGAVVASAFVRQMRSLDSKVPIQIYAGNPFSLTRGDDGKERMRLDFVKGSEVLQWMHDKGVRIVVTAFNSPDAKGAARFMDKADELGMIVFAAYSNDRGVGKVYPAADPRAVSVVDTSIGKLGEHVIKGAGRQFDGAAAGVRYAMDGRVPQGAYGALVMTGSSFASPKAAAYAAYALARNPGMTRGEVMKAMDVATKPMNMSREDAVLTIARLGDADTDKRFLQEQSGVAALSQGPLRVGQIVQLKVAMSSPSGGR